MQNLELLLLIVSMIYIGFQGRINMKLKKSYVLGLLLLILAVHLIFDGARWQMVPGYTFGSLLLFWPSDNQSPDRQSFLKCLKLWVC